MNSAGNDLITHAAELLRGAYASGVPIPPLRKLLKDVPGDDIGYAVQRVNTEHWIKEGRQPMGCKIGLTAKAVQRQLGVDEPDYGILFSDMCLGTGEQVRSGTVLQPKVEAEIALVLDRDLDMDDPTVVDVIRATAFALPAIEIVGSRIAKWDIRLIDTVADNASSALIVLGGPPRNLAGLDLTDCQMRMVSNDQEISSGVGSACLGSPLNAATWLARKMCRLGTPLRAGDTIMTGALGPMATVQPGNVVKVTIDGVGSVQIAFGKD